MSLFLTDFDQWYEIYETGSPKQQFELIQSEIAQPIPLSFAHEIDLGMFLVEQSDRLINLNRIDDILTFIQVLQQKQPELYQEEFQYFDSFLVRYHLFHRQMEPVKENLSRFQTHPVQSIDQLIPVLNHLRCYGAMEPLVQLCQAVYEPIAISPDLIGGSEIEFGSVLLTHLVEETYRRLKLGEAIDWDAFMTEATGYGLQDDPQVCLEIQRNLSFNLNNISELLPTFKHNRQVALRQLLLAFCRYQLDNGIMPFICAQAIWEPILEFLEQRELPKRHLSPPNTYFQLNQPTLDRFVAQRIGGLFSRQQATGFAILWGIPYLYEFLHTHQLITQSTLEQALSISLTLKTQLIQAFSNHLWQYDFVHQWAKPNSLSEAEFTAEANLFAASIEHSQPLSEQPIERPSLSSQLDRLTQDAMANLTHALPARHPAQPHSPKLKGWKAPKPRKSPLHEASSDQSSPKQADKKNKRKNKGFG